MIHDSAFLALMGLQTLADHPSAPGKDGVSPAFKEIFKRAAAEERHGMQQAVDSARNVTILPGRNTAQTEAQDHNPIAGKAPASGK